MDGEVRQEVAKQLVKGYLVHMLVYIVVVLAFLGIAYRWCGSQVWYPWDELYPLVHWLHVNVVPVFLCVLLVGCVAITCVHFYQMARLLELYSLSMFFDSVSFSTAVFIREYILIPASASESSHPDDPVIR